MQTLLYNKNKHVSPQKIDDMLSQLRQLINQQSNRKSPYKQSLLQKQQKHHLSNHNSNIQSIIQQSTKLLQKNNKIKSIKSNIRNKILAASQILKDQNQLVKNYIRDKIQSELFTSAIQGQQYSSIKEQKRKIIRLRQIQLEKQNQNKKKIIQNVKQFNEDSRVKVSIHEIDNLIYKEQPNSSYLLNLQNGKKISSNSNQIKNSNLFFQKNSFDNQEENSIAGNKKSSKSNINLKGASQKSKSQHIQPQFDQDFKQITEEPQGYEKFSNLQTTNPRLFGLNKVLQKYPHLVTIFYQFLKNQIKINSLDSAFKIMPKILSDQLQALKQQQNQGQKFIWKCNKLKKQNKNSFLNSSQKKQIPTINNIASKYRFKAFGINQQSKLQPERKKISQRRINKMIGQSKNFHPKKCILTKNQLIYYQQKDKAQQSNSSMFEMCLPQSTKKIQFQIQRIKLDKFLKQQGSFFSKKQINIQIIQLKGKNRNIKFQKNFLQGQQLVYDLKKLMANKIYRQSCIYKGINNINLYEFINNPLSKYFQLSTQIITPTIQLQQNHFSLITDLISQRKQIQILKINGAKLLNTQLNQTFIQSKQFIKLKKIQLSYIKLNKQSFLILCQFVNQLYNKGQIDVILKDTKLDDQCFVSNVGPFTSFCSKVKFLDISENSITIKTLQIIKNCLESVTCMIQYLNISQCPIFDLMKVINMFREARKLQNLQAQGCGFRLNLINQIQFQKIFQFLKKCTSTFKRLNIKKNGSISINQYSIIQRMWLLQSIQNIQIDYDINKYLQIKKSSNNNKNNQNLSKSQIPNYINLQIIKKE